MMDLRDWFAGQALAGMMAHPDADYSLLSVSGVTNFASDAFTVADAMIAARSADHAEPSPQTEATPQPPAASDARICADCKIPWLECDCIPF